MEPKSIQELVDQPHGYQEELKMDLLAMIQEAKNPYEIIYEIANYLEDVSGERGYGQHIIDNIHTVYGIALKEKKPLADQLQILQARQERIQQSLTTAESNPDSSEEERARMNFAIKAHQRKIQQLQQLLAEPATTLI